MKATSEELYIEQFFLSHLKMKLWSSDNFMPSEFYNYLSKCLVDDHLLTTGKISSFFFFSCGACKSISSLVGLWCLTKLEGWPLR